MIQPSEKEKQRRKSKKCSSVKLDKQIRSAKNFNCLVIPMPVISVYNYKLHYLLSVKFGG